MKRFIVPCFVVVDAENESAANDIAATYQNKRSDSFLLLDEGLPTVEYKQKENEELVHSLVDIFPNNVKP